MVAVMVEMMAVMWVDLLALKKAVLKVERLVAKKAR